jgi:general stress protein 26
MTTEMKSVMITAEYNGLDYKKNSDIVKELSTRSKVIVMLQHHVLKTYAEVDTTLRLPNPRCHGCEAGWAPEPVRSHGLQTPALKIVASHCTNPR